MFTKDDKAAPPAAAATPASRAAAVLAGKTHEVVRTVELARVGRVGVRLLRRAEQEQVDIDVTTWLLRAARERGVSPDDLLGVGTLPLNSRKTVETLARALRDPDDPAKPWAASVDEIVQFDDEILGEMTAAYHALRVELDPLGGTLTPEEFTAIVEAGKKKDRIRLFEFGASKLSAFIASTESRPAS